MKLQLGAIGITPWPWQYYEVQHRLTAGFLRIALGQLVHYSLADILRWTILLHLAFC